MKFPRKRTILFWHRWLGILSALFLVSLSITGVLLNHTSWLKLDKIMVNSSFVLEKYGMANRDDIKTFRIHSAATLSQIDTNLFYNTHRIANAGEILGIWEGEMFSVIVSSKNLIFLSKDGQLIESVDTSELPFDRIERLGEGLTDEIVIVSDNGNWTLDKDGLEYSPFKTEFSALPLVEAQVSKTAQEAILSQYQGEGISLYRVLLDLHSGRLFGWGGRTLMDLTAIAVLVLVSTGIGGWLRKAKFPRSYYN